MTVERIVIADADYAVLDWLGSQLAAHGYDVFLATSVGELTAVAAASGCDVALIDLALPGGGGLEAARKLCEMLPEAMVTLIGEPAELSRRSDELLPAHFGTLQKPVGPGQVLLAIEQAAQLKRLREENRMLRRQWEADEGPEDFVSHSPGMVDVLRQAATIADTTAPLVIYGAPGTEKEIVALYVHRLSDRADGPFIRFDCGRTAPAIEEADLFGREYHGANGSVWRGSGRLDLAAEGSLFLDNITELSPRCQAKLLRLIDEGRFLRADSSNLHPAVRGEPRPLSVSLVDVRIIAASSHSLDEAGGSSGFRQDLLFRLNGLSVTLPSLAERPEDVLPLARRFLRRFASEDARAVREISDDAAGLLQEYDWPGNVAELRDTIRAAVLGAEGDVLGPEDLLRGPSRRILSGVIDAGHGARVGEERPPASRTGKTAATRRLFITTGSLANRLARCRPLTPQANRAEQESSDEESA